VVGQILDIPQLQDGKQSLVETETHWNLAFVLTQQLVMERTHCSSFRPSGEKIWRHWSATMVLPQVRQNSFISFN